MAHIHEKIDFVADTYIVSGDTVLLRKHDKGGQWFPPGGHIELDEGPEEAAVREVKEEVGLDVQLVDRADISFESGEKELVLPRFMNRHRINDTHEHISLAFFATADSSEVTQGEREVSEEIRWFTREELDDPKWGIRERVRHYAKTALNELGTKK